MFTPQGDVKDLPAGSTPLDFAYRIHTDVGHSCIGAKVNNRLVPLDYKLKNGDIVEIVTTKSAHGPSRDWLNIVTTAPRQGKDPPVVQAPGARGEHRPRQGGAGSRAAPPGPDVARRDRRASSSRRWPSTTSSPTLDDFYAAIGYGAVSAQQVVTRLGRRRRRQRDGAAAGRAAARPTRTGGIRVKGVGDLLIRFRKCCHPIPGDPIVGYITRGRGVTVHLATCPTVVNEKDVGRLIEVEWEGRVQQTYPIAIRVEAYDRPGCCPTSPTSWPRTRSTSSPRT